MNPYLSFGLAMCGIVLVSLVATAYMAVYFNRRARADLERALSPLAELLDGEVDLDEAAVNGRYRGQIAWGRVVSGPAGAGRYFQSGLIDSAGGGPWKWTATQPKQAGLPQERTLVGSVDAVHTEIVPLLNDFADRTLVAPGWFRVEYDPTAGHLQHTRPMAARRDVPSAERFRATLDELLRFADVNRGVQAVSGST